MPAWLRRMWIQMTADRKRFGVLCATVAVGLLLWARLIIVSQVPRTAMADQTASLGGKTAANGKVAVGAPADKSDARGGGKRDAKSSRVMEVRLWSTFGRDPFVISPEHFPREMPRKEVKQEAGKLPTEPAEDVFQAEARVAARLAALVGSMKLEAAMDGSMAVIDGRRYRVGDIVSPAMPASPGMMVDGERVRFTLVEVKQRSVVLAFRGRRFELEMTLPGAGGTAS